MNESAADGKPILAFEDKRAWTKWLKTNHAASSGVWLRLAKKGSAAVSVSRADSLDVALCFGWIDGQALSEGEETWLLKYTPRTKRSIWSKRNREHVARLIASGEMSPVGLAEVDRAKADGRWDAAYDGPKNMPIPDDFAAALSRNKKARSFFESLDSRNRFAILFRIHQAKKAETRIRRISRFVAMLERNEKLHS